MNIFLPAFIRRGSSGVLATPRITVLGGSSFVSVLCALTQSTVYSLTLQGVPNYALG